MRLGAYPILLIEEDEVCQVRPGIHAWQWRLTAALALISDLGSSRTT